MSLYKSKFTVRLPKHCKTFMLEMHSIIIANFTTIIHLDSNMLADIWLRIFFLIGHFRPVCFLSLTFYSHTHKCNVYFLFVFFRKQKRNHMQNQFRNFSQANLSKWLRKRNETYEVKELKDLFSNIDIWCSAWAELSDIISDLKRKQYERLRVCVAI